MKLLISTAVFFLLCSLAWAAPPPLTYELACPSGYSPAVNGGQTFDSLTGQYRANVCVSNKGDGRIVCQMDGCGSTVTAPFASNNVPCSSLNSNSTNDNGCGAQFNSFILQSKGSTANNLRHNVSSILETDLHQTAGGNEFWDLTATAAALLDSGSTGAAGQRLIGIEAQATVSDLASSGLNIGNVDIFKARSTVNANAHVTNLVGLLLYLPQFSTGSVTSNYSGVTLDAPAGGGSVTNAIPLDVVYQTNGAPTTNAVGIRAGVGGTQITNGWGGWFTAPNGAVLADDSTVQSSFIGHSTGLFPNFVLHDGWYSGTGAPSFTAAKGSLYSRRDGGTGSSVCINESGSTSWSCLNGGVTTQAVLAHTFSTVYHNTSGKPIFVSISAQINGGGAAGMAAYTDAAATPTTLVQSCSTNLSSSFQLTLFFIVLPGNYYTVTPTNMNSLNTWVEWN